MIALRRPGQTSFAFVLDLARTVGEMNWEIEIFERKRPARASMAAPVVQRDALFKRRLEAQPLASERAVSDQLSARGHHVPVVRGSSRPVPTALRSRISAEVTPVPLPRSSL